MPLGYEVVIFEKADKPGGLMRSNIPPSACLKACSYEEIDYILDMGVDIRYNASVDSMKALLDEAIRRCLRRLRRAARQESRHPRTLRNRPDPHRYRLAWNQLPSATSDSIGEHVLIIGVGNTAMDCCRTSRRLGGKDIKVMARRPRGYFKASPWELEDAEEEGVEISSIMLRSDSCSKTESLSAWNSNASNGTAKPGARKSSTQ